MGKGAVSDMQFLILCCFNENKWDALPESQRDQIMSDYGRLVADLKKSGHLIAGAKLEDSSHAVTIRHKAGQPIVSDGPFAETKEQLGGYHLVECAGMDEAMALAQRIPTLPFGGAVEVRAVQYPE